VTTNINFHSLENKENLTVKLPVNLLHGTNSVVLTSIKYL